MSNQPADQSANKARGSAEQQRRPDIPVGDGEGDRMPEEQRARGATLRTEGMTPGPLNKATDTTEPSEPMEPSVRPSLKGRLCGEPDSSVWDRDETRERARALGISTPLYKPFPCVLPGHEDQARLHPTSAGYWNYYCEELGRGVGLGEARAFLGYGREMYVRGPLAARWSERLDFDAWLRWPVPLEVDLPEPCPRPARELAEWMAVFVGLRDARWPLDEPFVFGHAFAQAYTGLTADRVKAGKSWLERARVLHRRGTHGRAILWILEAQLHAATGQRSDTSQCWGPGSDRTPD